MFRMRCIVCGSTHTKKNGVRKGVLLYKCQDCSHDAFGGDRVGKTRKQPPSKENHSWLLCGKY